MQSDNEFSDAMYIFFQFKNAILTATFIKQKIKFFLKEKGHTLFALSFYHLR